MSPIYENEAEGYTRSHLDQMRRKNVCKECGGTLTLFLEQETRFAYLACSDYPTTHHEGIERPPTRYETGGLAEFNIPARREIMVDQIGTEKTKALGKYMGTVTITKAIATEIVETIWGDAPLIEKTKAILLCQSYQLNPLMRHLHLVPYRRKDSQGNYMKDPTGEFILDWSIQQGIGATRLLAQRKHHFTYVDMTPRKATQYEIDKILGDTADPSCIYGFTHIKDVDTGAEAFGLRGINKNDNIKGKEKGNTLLNMACIRSERQAIDRQYPGEMPEGIDVFDERFMDEGEATDTAIDAEYREVDGRTVVTSTGEIVAPEHWCTEHNCAYQLKRGRGGKTTWYAHPLPDGKWCNEIKKKEAAQPKAAQALADDMKSAIQQSEAAPETAEPEPTQDSRAEAWEKEPETQSHIDLDWVRESMKTLHDKGIKSWSESNVLSFMLITYKVEAPTVVEAVAKLDKGGAAHFEAKLQEILEMA